MPKPPPPDHVREVKSALRRASKIARDARREWTSLRDIYKAGMTPESADVTAATRRMWAADLALDRAAARLREVLNERAAMPVAERWDLAALEQWAVALDKAGEP